jgi:hypothetical protein
MRLNVSITKKSLFVFFLAFLFIGCRQPQPEEEIREKIFSIDNEYVKTGIIKSDDSPDPCFEDLANIVTEHKVELSEDEWKTLDNADDEFRKKAGQVHLSEKEIDVLKKLEKSTDLIVDYVVSNSASFSRRSTIFPRTGEERAIILVFYSLQTRFLHLETLWHLQQEDPRGYQYLLAHLKLAERLSSYHYLLSVRCAGDATWNLMNHLDRFTEDEACTLLDCLRKFSLEETLGLIVGVKADHLIWTLRVYWSNTKDTELKLAIGAIDHPDMFSYRRYGEKSYEDSVQRVLRDLDQFQEFERALKEYQSSNKPVFDYLLLLWETDYIPPLCLYGACNVEIAIGALNAVLFAKEHEKLPQSKKDIFEGSVLRRLNKYMDYKVTETGESATITLDNPYYIEGYPTHPPKTLSWTIHSKGK